MIVHQRTFNCKVGHAGQVVRLIGEFRRITEAAGVQAHAERVYTDLTGRNDQVIWQVELDRLADWEAAVAQFFQDASFAPWFEELATHIEGSDSQFFQLQ